MKKKNMPSIKIGTSKVDDKRKFDENYDYIFRRKKNVKETQRDQNGKDS